MNQSINNTPLTENLKKSLNTGLVPAINPVKDFFPHDVTMDSWFVIGHYEVEGHILNCLFQLMITKNSGAPEVMNANLSITDETTGWYHYEDHIYPLNVAQIGEMGEGVEKKLSIKVPNGSLVGNLDEMHWEAEMPHGKFSLDMKSLGMCIYNAGTGNFTTPFNQNINQYSVPNLQTNGTMTLDGKTYEIKGGRSWFDRQWQYESKDFTGGKCTWSWMDLNLDNGDFISLWDMNNFDTGVNNAWATVLHPDGTQSVCCVERLAVSASEYWSSDKSGQNYPTHYTVRIPELGAELEVSCRIKEQEIVSQMPFLHKYEGASTINGTYKGERVTGYCYVELLGDWRDTPQK